MDDNIIEDSEIETYFDNNALKTYMQEIQKYPLLKSDEFLKYFKEYKNGNIESREKLINSNLRLVVSIAFQNQNKIKHLHILDIIQEGNLGLMRALETYDPEIASFSTYATQWIQQAIFRSIEDKEDEIRTVKGRIYINNLPKENYELISNDNKKASFEITDTGKLVGKIKENINESKPIIVSAIAELIITIQTGTTYINYILIIITLLSIIASLYLMQKKTN